MDFLDRDIELAKAFSEQIRTANRRWAFVMAIGLLSLGYTPGKDYPVLGTTIPDNSVVAVLIAALVAGNIAFSNAQATLVNSMRLFQKSIVGHSDRASQLEEQLIIVSDKQSYLDYLYVWVHSAYDRVYPIFKNYPDGVLKRWTYSVTKAVISSFYILLPAALIIYLWLSFSVHVPASEGVVIPILGFFSIVSVLMSLTNAVRIVLYAIFEAALGKGKK